MNEYWDEYWKSAKVDNRSYSKQRIISILSKYVKKDMVVLDAGCGSGFFSSYFISRECKVYSLDWSENALEMTRRATKNKCHNYLRRNLLDANLGIEFKDYFDLVFTDGLFEHFSNREQTLIMNNFKKMVKKDGFIITFVPNLFSFWTLIRPVFMKNIKEKPFTLDDLARFIDRSNQQTTESGGINVLPIKYSPEILAKQFGMLLYAVTTIE
jgi:2-polyprenyl-3-methyl-5-hydroxy-6-metoxy-1,4-benzoquinol methylase